MAVWRKSSRSGQGGNANCVEVALWRKSSRSGGGGNDDCVEVSVTDLSAGVRDSKNASGPHLTFPALAWKTFLTTT
ncbi:MAG TPA: DUF397 domain-containing protein [Actinokineospora sp.]|jgi:hypothetical protein|nr:DUF397 domain-containing protein [Actinokineospora sp.]